MDGKALRRIRRSNVEQLEELLPALEENVARSQLEKKFCVRASQETGICEFAESRAQELITKFLQEHDASSLYGSNETNPSWKSGGDKKQARKKGRHAEQSAMKARNKIFNELEEEKGRFDVETETLASYCNILHGVLSNFNFSDESDSDEEECAKGEIEKIEKIGKNEEKACDKCDEIGKKEEECVKCEDEKMGKNDDEKESAEDEDKNETDRATDEDSTRTNEEDESGEEKKCASI